MKLIESKNKNYITEDYSIFKNLLGNREIGRARITKAKRGFKEAGQQIIPVAVNEKFEIIEGQARVLAAKELGIPIEYTIRKGASVKDAILLNTTATSWKAVDYIRSYAKQGNEDYAFLLNMIEKYPYFKVSLITTVALGKRTTGGNSTSIRSGKISFTPAEMLAIDTKLEWISGFVGIVNRLAGRKLNWYDALSFVYDEPSVSNEILKEKIIKNAHLIHSAPTILEAVEQLEKIYNLYSRGEIVYIAQMFRVEQDRKRRVKS